MVPDVAVVVPSGRGAEAAAACVRAIRAAADGVHADVVVVADGPRWPEPLPAVEGARVVRSASLAPAHATTAPAPRTAPVGTATRTAAPVGTALGPSAARNTGIALTSAPFVVTTDDDVRPRAGWLRSLVDALSPSDAGVGGPVVAHRPSTLLGRFADWRHPLDAQLDPRRTRYLVTANSLWRRAALDEVGVFDESFRAPGGEELELCDRLLAAGWTLGWAPDAVVEHEFDVGLRRFLRTNYAYGRGTSMAYARMGRPVRRARLLRSYAAVVVRRPWRETPPSFAALELLATSARMVGEVRHAGRP